MYEVEYKCIRKPMPVIIRRKTTDSWSTWKANGILKLATLIKSKRLTTEAPLLFTSIKRRMLIMNESKIIPLPITPVALFDKDFLKSPFIKKPSKGNNGTR